MKKLLFVLMTVFIGITALRAQDAGEFSFEGRGGALFGFHSFAAGFVNGPFYRRGLTFGVSYEISI